MRSLFARLFSKSQPKPEVAQVAVGTLDYDQWIHFDAEDLAEQGIAKAYKKVLPELAKYIAHPAELTELVDHELPSYKIQCDGQEYLIWSAEEAGTEQASWGRATYFFFLLVNRQLADTDVQLYAINSDNDLGGMFLTREQAESEQAFLPTKTHWPYIPELSEPWYGQFH